MKYETKHARAQVVASQLPPHFGLMIFHPSNETGVNFTSTLFFYFTLVNIFVEPVFIMVSFEVLPFRCMRSSERARSPLFRTKREGEWGCANTKRMSLPTKTGKCFLGWPAQAAKKEGSQSFCRQKRAVKVKTLIL